MDRLTCVKCFETFWSVIFDVRFMIVRVDLDGEISIKIRFVVKYRVLEII